MLSPQTDRRRRAGADPVARDGDHLTELARSSRYYGAPRVNPSPSLPRSVYIYLGCDPLELIYINVYYIALFRAGPIAEWIVDRL